MIKKFVKQINHLFENYTIITIGILSIIIGLTAVFLPYFYLIITALAWGYFIIKK